MTYLKLTLLGIAMIIFGMLLGTTLFDFTPVQDHECRAVIAVTGGICP